jgi:hypothetical protein
MSVDQVLRTIHDQHSNVDSVSRSGGVADAFDETQENELAAMLADINTDIIVQPDRSKQNRNINICQDCCIEYEIVDMKYECPECHKVAEADYDVVFPTQINEIPGIKAMKGTLRITGKDSNKYQADMYSSNPTKSSDQQINTLYKFLIKLNIDYQAKTRDSFPLNVLYAVAIIYNQIQQKEIVKRSNAKRKIIAALLDKTCISKGFTKSKSAIAKFAGLKNNGLADGDNTVRLFAEQGILDIDVNENPLPANIATTFIKLGIEDRYDLKRAVTEIVELADEELIGCSSIMRSKTVAATLNLMRRADIKITLQEISVKCDIRPYTIKQFLTSLMKYHDVFESIYEKYNLSVEEYKW